MKSSQQMFKDAIDKQFGTLGAVSGDIDTMLSAQRIKGALSEEDFDIKFIKPNFDREFDEAKRYREFKGLSRKEWVDMAKNGSVTTFEKIKKNLGNIDLNFEKLDKEKRARFQAAFKNKRIEVPIVVKFKDNDYDLLGGNTRLAGLVRKGLNPKLWLIDMSKSKKLETTEAEKLKGGLADKMSLGDIAHKHKVDVKVLTKQFLKGIKIEMEHTDDKNKASEIVFDHLAEDPKYYTKLKKIETKEVTGSGSSGSYVGPFAMDSKFMEKSNEETPNKIEANEVTGASSAGQYSSPAMWAKTTNKKDWRGASKPLYQGGKFVQVKGKCKKFPYCNQGDIKALKIWENEKLAEAIESVSKKTGLNENVIKNILYHEMESIKVKKK